MYKYGVKSLWMNRSATTANSNTSKYLQQQLLHRKGLLPFHFAFIQLKAAGWLLLSGPLSMWSCLSKHGMLTYCSIQGNLYLLMFFVSGPIKKYCRREMDWITASAIHGQWCAGATWCIKTWLSGYCISLQYCLLRAFKLERKL